MTGRVRVPSAAPILGPHVPRGLPSDDVHMTAPHRPVGYVRPPFGVAAQPDARVPPVPPFHEAVGGRLNHGPASAYGAGIVALPRERVLSIALVCIH